MHKLFDNIEKFKNKIGIVDSEGKEYSYSEILEKTKNIDLKINPGSLILLIAENNFQSLIGYISFMRSNNVLILLDKSFKAEYAYKIVRRYKPNYIFCPNGYLPEIEKTYKTITFGTYNLIKTNSKKIKKLNKQNYLLLSTSGTTQSPKFVRLSNENLLHNAKKIINYLKIKSNHTTITTMPMGYSYGLSIINTHILSGSKIILNNSSIFEKNFWHKINKYKITSFGGVPQFYEQLKKIKFDNFNLSSIKYFTQAGGKLDKNFLKYFIQICKNKKIKFIVMYGQTEASPRMSYLKWDDLPFKIDSIGKPLSGTKFKIFNNKGQEIRKPFLIGELVYFGKNVSLGYAKNMKDLTKGNTNKGKLFTGDLAYKDKEGFFYISGRKNRISKVFGVRIDLDDIEKQLKKNNYKVKCVPSNRYLKVLVIQDYNIDNIKNIVQNLYRINKNFIHILKVKQFNHQNYFKEMIK